MQRFMDLATIGEQFLIEGSAVIQNEAGDQSNIVIGDYSRVCNATLICKANAKLTLGNYSVVQDHVFLRCAQEISIGNFVGIAENSVVVDNNTHRLGLENWIEHRVRVAPGGPGYPGLGNGWELSDSDPIRIEDGVWIGANCTVLKGVTIGEGAVVARGSIVTKDVEPHTLVAGLPAKPIKTLEKPERSIEEIAAEFIQKYHS